MWDSMLQYFDVFHFCFLNKPNIFENLNGIHDGGIHVEAFGEPIVGAVEEALVEASGNHPNRAD